jgi:hypothetical protein
MRGSLTQLKVNPLLKFRKESIIKRFVNGMILSLRSRTFNLLQEEHFNLINDVVHYGTERSVTKF